MAQVVWLCGPQSGCREESNPPLRQSCFSFFLIFHLFVFLCDVSAFPGAGKSNVSFWHWAPDASGKDVSSYRDSRNKLTLVRGLVLLLCPFTFPLASSMRRP